MRNFFVFPFQLIDVKDTEEDAGFRTLPRFMSKERTIISVNKMMSDMNRKFLIIKGFTLVCLSLLTCCSSDDLNDVDPVDDDAQFVLIQSDNGETSKVYLYKKDDRYCNDCYPCYDCYPRCYVARTTWRVNNEEVSVYMMEFTASIKRSDIFDLLQIACPENNQPIYFRDLKPGDVLDLSKFHVTADYAKNSIYDVEQVLISAIAQSGKITVVGTKIIDGQSYMTLNLSDLRFLSRDKSCVYTINGTVDYEILNDQYDNE